MKNAVLIFAAAAAVLMGSASSAAAQGSATTFDVGAAYQFVYRTARELAVDGNDDGQSFPVGVAIDAARYWGALGLAVEGGLAYDSTEFSDRRSVFAGLSAKTTFFHAGAGPRLTVRRPGRVRPYAQVLLGVSSVRFGIEDLDNRQTAFMIQPGGGVNFLMGDAWGFFGDLAYRRSFFENSRSNEIRSLVGARMLLD
jgi:hypothetical protein